MRKQDRRGVDISPATMSDLVSTTTPSSLGATWLEGVDKLPAASTPATLFLAGLRWLGTMRWPLVMGWEYEGVDAQRSARPRALLLLDALWPEPWGTGHNARLQLKRGRTGTSTPLTYRGLDGQTATVQLAAVLALSRPAPT